AGEHDQQGDEPRPHPHRPPSRSAANLAVRGGTVERRGGAGRPETLTNIPRELTLLPVEPEHDAYALVPAGPARRIIHAPPMAAQPGEEDVLLPGESPDAEIARSVALG